jgi:hypothetical protein
MQTSLRNLVLLALTLFGSNSLPANAGDALATGDKFKVILKIEDGSVQDHVQNLTSAQCEAALETFRKARGADQDYTLTIEAPTRVIGIVLEMSCTGPDGSIRGIRGH